MSVAKSACLVAAVVTVAVSDCGWSGGTARVSMPPSSSSSPSPSTSSAGVLPTGPGPQAVYTIQPQPPAGTCRYRHTGSYALPDPKCNPGATNPKVTQATIGSTICVQGYTATIRPPQSITGPEKRADAASYGYTGSFLTAEFDHLLPLELGGDPADPRNLWIEPNDSPSAQSFRNTKDLVEGAARAAVCAEAMKLTDAQRAMVTDWVVLGRALHVLRP